MIYFNITALIFDTSLFALVLLPSLKQKFRNKFEVGDFVFGE